MYGFQPRASMAVGLEKEKVQAAKDFLKDMNQMLNLAKDSIKRAQDRARSYAEHEFLLFKIDFLMLLWTRTLR